MSLYLTGSRVPLLAKCKYAFRDDIERQPWATSRDAQVGRALHRISEWYVNKLPPDVVMAAREFDVEDDVPRIAKTWLKMADWIDAQPGEKMAEVKIAVDLLADTAHILTDKGDRNYVSALPHEIPMTLDLVIIHRGKVTVYDWKTGHNADGYWPQVAIGAVAASRYWREQDIDGVILHATEDDVDDSRRRPFSYNDLACLADDILDDIGEITNSIPNPGPHCREMRCAAFGSCPATLAALAEVRDLAPANDGGRIRLPVLDAHKAADYLEMARTAIALGEQVKKAVEVFVGDEEHEVKDGVLKKTFRNVTRTDVAKLMDLARAHGATVDEIAACSYKHQESAGLRIVKKKSA